MATMEKDEHRGAYLLYSLFHKYALRAPADASHGVSSISYAKMKELMLDMDLLEGVPPALMDVFVREHMQRADQEGSGVIGAQDFMVWLLTEVAALLPIRDSFCNVTGLRPLYNQFHAVLLGDVGFTDGARRPALGMAAAQFSRLSEEYGLSSSATSSATSNEGVRYAFKAARASMGAFRASSGANTGAQMAEPAGGGRLQFAAFVRALAVLAAQRRGSLDAALYQVVSCGVAANLTDPRIRKPPLPQAEVTSVGLGSRLEGTCTKESYTCDNCGQEHQRWRLDNWIRLEELLLSLGIPQPVRRFMPAMPLLNARNLRAAFHRYNAMYNKGKLPPATYRLPQGEEAESGSGAAAGAGAGAGATTNDGGGGAGACGGGCCSQAAAYGACCCLYRSLSVMEMSSWLRLCGDCDAIRDMISTHGSGVTPATLESAFVQASSVAGVYLPDESSGIHDVPIATGEGGAKLGLPRNSLGAVVGSEARASPGNPPPKRSTAAYQAPPEGHPMAAAVAAAAGSGGGGGDIVPRLHEVQGPNSAAAWLASTRSLPYGSSAAATAARGQQHRPSRLALTFPQFLEALRLVAEEAGGHPTRTTAAERALLRIVHDIIREGCPRPDPTTATGTAQIRKQQLRRAGAAGGVIASLPTRPPPPLPTGAAGPETLSATSSTTSTKYTYDDFTPPESNLYTSATSSRISSRPCSASGRRNAGGGGGGSGGCGLGQGNSPAAAALSATTSTTSTKYTYDDFTPPDSNLYSTSTSAASSTKVGSTGVGPQTQFLSNQCWRPQPVKSFGNSNTAVAGAGEVKAPLPMQLQSKKQRGGVVATEAITTMPPPPTARIRTTNTLAPNASAARNANNSGVSGGGGGVIGTNGSSEQRARPSSAPRGRQQPSAVGFEERIEYFGYSTTAIGGGGGSGSGDRPTSRPRPASAKQQRPDPPTASNYRAPTPPFSLCARPTSALAQRSRPQTASEVRVRARSPPAAVATSPARAAAAVWDPPGASGQIRTASPGRVRPYSANAAVRQTVGARSNTAAGAAKPLFRLPPPNPAPMGGTAAAAAAATAGAGGGNRPPAGRPPPSPSMNSPAHTTLSIRTASGTGFVTPLLPVTSSDGGAAEQEATVERSPRRPLSGAAVAVAASMKAEAAAAAALAAAAAARHGAIGRQLPQPLAAAGSADCGSLATVYPNTSTPSYPALGNDKPGGTGVRGGGSPSQRQPSPLASLPPGSGSGSGSGPRNLFLLQAVETVGTFPSSPRTPGAGSSPENGPPPLPLAAVSFPGDAVQRGKSTFGVTAATGASAQPPPSAGTSQLEHVTLPYESVSLPIRMTHPSSSTNNLLAVAAPHRQQQQQQDHDDGDDSSSVGGIVAEDMESTMALSPRALLAAAFSTKNIPVPAGPQGRTRLPAEGTVNGLPQYFFG